MTQVRHLRFSTWLLTSAEPMILVCKGQIHLSRPNSIASSKWEPTSNVLASKLSSSVQILWPTKKSFWTITIVPQTSLHSSATITCNRSLQIVGDKLVDQLNPQVVMDWEETQRLRIWWKRSCKSDMRVPVVVDSWSITWPGPSQISFREDRAIQTNS